MGLKVRSERSGVSGRAGPSASFPTVEVKARSPGLGVHQQRCFLLPVELVQSSAHQL